MLPLPLLPIGKKGTLFRYSGEEFVVLVETLKLQEAANLAEKIREKVEEYSWEDTTPVTVSIGVAESSAALRDVLNKADQNLYEAKMQGRNRVVYHK